MGCFQMAVLTVAAVPVDDGGLADVDRHHPTDRPHHTRNSLT